MDFIPNELILHIFEFLDRDSLKSALSVNKRFRELIITNSHLMRKLPLKLSKNWLTKVEFASNFGFFVKSLIMEYTTFESLDEFKEIINLFPNIEKLKIIYIYIKQPSMEVNEEEEVNPNRAVQFSHLKSMELSSKFWGYITQLDSKILQHLNTSHLEEFLIKLPMQKLSPYFIDFLCRQSRLSNLQIFDEFIDSFLFDDFTESLTYNQFISSLFESDVSTKASFQLRKLSINYRGDHRENFQKFLTTQNELEELEIRKYEDDFVRFKLSFDLMRDFRVRKLTIPFELMPSNVLSDVDRYVNRNVIDLSLRGYNNDEQLFNLMLKMFPNIRRLRLEYMLEFECHDLATLPHLECLEVDHFKIDCLANIKINKLQSLKIGTLYPFVYNDWEGITKVNCNIVEIIVREVSHFNTMTAIKNSITIMLHDLKQLKYLKVIQNDSSDCLKIIADIRNKRLLLSSYAMKMLRETFTQTHAFDAINLMF
jgi:hypothetical protein